MFVVRGRHKKSSLHNWPKNCGIPREENSNRICLFAKNITTNSMIYKYPIKDYSLTVEVDLIWYRAR